MQLNKMIAERMPGRAASDSGTGQELRQRFIARDMAVRTALQDLRRWLLARGLQPDLIGRTELALAEILNNIAEHGYHPDLPGWIALRCRLGRRGVLFAVMDSGRRMPDELLQPPTGAMPVHCQPDIDALPEGGFGWFLIHRLTRDMTCQRDRTGNRLTFRVPHREADSGPMPG